MASNELVSSYNTTGLTYRNMFQVLVGSICPSRVVEFGILKGYSLSALHEFCRDDCQIEAYDIFEKFNGNGANHEELVKKFGDCANIQIDELDFYKGSEWYGDGEIDILHIDIANNGDVFKFAVENYLQKVSREGVMVFEGGSVERDDVEWMKKYGKPSIVEYLNKLREERKDLVVTVVDVFPSMTIIRRTRTAQV
jgi:hypothetical protein